MLGCSEPNAQVRTAAGRLLNPAAALGSKGASVLSLLGDLDPRAAGGFNLSLYENGEVQLLVLDGDDRFDR